ncbi:MAG: RsiV family protein [Armatimonadota bacterium]|nr:RsiV family protein [Armatimonadota bacterium]
MNIRLLALALLFAFGSGTAGRAQTTSRVLNGSRHGRYQAVTHYPILRTRTPLTRFANSTLLAWARSEQRTFAREVGEARAGRKTLDAQEGVNPYAYEARPIYIHYFAPRLFSVGMEEYTDLGGAHPSTERDTFNFGLVHGQPKRLTLGDFFRPGAAYRARVQKVVLAKLRKTGRADWLQDGSVKTLTRVEINRFVVERDGLRFYLNPYDVGSYASGPFQVKLRWAELGPSFNRSLVSAR